MKQNHLPRLTKTERILQDPVSQIKLDWNPDVCPDPTRWFQIGESVVVGHLENSTIQATHLDGKFYTVHYTQTIRDGLSENYGIWPWTEIFQNTRDQEQIGIPDDLRYQSTQSSVHELLLKVYHFGVDAEVGLPASLRMDSRGQHQTYRNDLRARINRVIRL